MSIDAIDKRIIARLQGDLPLVPRPFAPLAAELGIAEAEVVARIDRMKRQRIMRRFGATLRHQQSGFPANVMVAWRVAEERIEAVGEILSGFRHVSHCYWRRPCEGFAYNLFSMVHGASQDQCRRIVAEMAQKAGMDPADYALLFSVEELKKTSMQYY
ncbi:MAG: Lrp/AsnC family transcriptional regulator [Thermodesulfobacteriota bacterium]